MYAIYELLVKLFIWQKKPLPRKSSYATARGAVRGKRRSGGTGFSSEIETRNCRPCVEAASR